MSAVGQTKSTSLSAGNDHFVSGNGRWTTAVASSIFLIRQQSKFDWTGPAFGALVGRVAHG